MQAPRAEKKAVFLAPSADMETFSGFCFSSFAGELPLFETCRSLLSCKQGFEAGMGRSCRCQHPCPGGTAGLGTRRRGTSACFILAHRKPSSRRD